MTMKIAVIDDYQNAFPTLKCYAKLKDHEVVVYTDTEKDPARLAERLKDAEAVVLTQQRSRFPRAAIERLPKLKLVSQTGRATAHIDVAACTERGIVVSAGGGRQSTRDGGTDLGAHSGRAAAYSLRSQTIERRPLAIDVG